MTGFVETWKSIADTLHRSERWCRYQAQRPSDPLPVYKFGGRIRADLSDLEQWATRQRRQSQRIPRLVALLA